ncbi:hypothetical protein AC249_AIPGENE28976 [Exaiptasia diaphana]|nr:hypothetical protein AC249_AIPGENE28976 [Exaiptasia diaphana]
MVPMRLIVPVLLLNSNASMAVVQTHQNSVMEYQIANRQQKMKCGVEKKHGRHKDEHRQAGVGIAIKGVLTYPFLDDLVAMLADASQSEKRARARFHGGKIFTSG